MPGPGCVRRAVIRPAAAWLWRGGGSAQVALGAVPVGQWGGRGAGLQVTASGAAVVAECATGQINQPLTLDSNNRFSVPGTYTNSGGPVMVGGNKPMTVQYSGSTDGTTLLLTITFTNGAAPASYTLTFGTKPDLSMVVCPL